MNNIKSNECVCPRRQFGSLPVDFRFDCICRSSLAIVSGERPEYLIESFCFLNIKRF